MVALATFSIVVDGAAVRTLVGKSIGGVQALLGPISSGAGIVLKEAKVSFYPLKSGALHRGVCEHFLKHFFGHFFPVAGG
jgi:hypothetical protein